MSNNDRWTSESEPVHSRQLTGLILGIVLAALLILAVILILVLRPHDAPNTAVSTPGANTGAMDAGSDPDQEPSDEPTASDQEPVPVEPDPHEADTASGSNPESPSSGFVPEEWTVGNWDWSLEDGVLTIRGTGNVTRYTVSDTAPWSKSYSDVTRLVIEEGITGIGGETFCSLRNLRSANLPASLRYFEGSAFCGCNSLESIQVSGGGEFLLSVDGVLYSQDMKTILCYPENKAGEQYRISDQVTSIGFYAFASSQNLQDLDIPYGVIEIQDYAFYCSRLSKLELPASVTRFGSCAFCGSKLTSLEIPASVTEIGDRAFLNCHSLERIQIPAGILSIGYGAFSCCDKLTEIPVAATNPNYVSTDGVLYTRDMQTLICYPAGKEGSYFRVPDGVSAIEYWAFGDCKNLTEVVIPFGVESLNRTFGGCRNLTAVHIPESVTYIGPLSFDFCDNLTDVYYGGTQASWNAISVGSLNDPLLNATIHFNTN